MTGIYIMAGLAAVILAAYLAYATGVRGKVPPSISQTVFDLKHRWVWSAVIFVCAWLVCPAFVENTSENTKFLAFLTIVALGVLGVFPLCAKDMVTTHNVAGVAACILSQLAIALNSPEILVSWILFGVLMAWKECRWRWCFIAEVICFVNVVLFCII